MQKLLKNMVVMAGLASFLIHDASATENGLTAYPVGVNTVLNGLMPPPGATQFYSYSLYYKASKFASTDGENLIPDFRLSALVEAPRIIHTWQQTIGPFTMSSGVIVPISRIELSTPGGSGKRSALGDIILEPLLLGYSNPSHTFFAFVGSDIAVPTGSYSMNRASNTGLNTYSIMPYLSTTWFPSPAWEVSTTALVEARTKNSATRYQSGTVAVLDFVAGYSVTSQLQIGVQGYWLKQLNDDKANGISIPGDGFRGRAFAVGPQLRYMWSQAAGAVVKYQRETSVRNRSQGSKIWVELTFPM